MEVTKSVYVQLVKACLPDVLKKLDIEQIVEEKICSFDVIELEKSLYINY